MKANASAPLQSYVEIAWRRKWWIVVPLILSLGASAGIFHYLPKTYLSSTLILVEPQKVPEDYVKPTISANIEARLTTMRQQIMSRSLLQKIIDEHDLFQRERKGRTHEEMIDLMRGRIRVQTLGTSKNVDAFSISYQGETPSIAMNVASKLASIFIEENLKFREQLVEGTSDFLENELKGLKASLDGQEQEISDFKKQHIGELPGQLDANLRTLDRYQMELQSITNTLRITDDRKSNIERLLSEQGRVRIEGDSPSGTTTTLLRPEEARLIRLRHALEVLRAEYKESYPDIIVLKNEIEQLEEALRHPPKEETMKAGVDAPSRALLPQELAFYRDLEKQLEEVKIEVRSLRRRQRDVMRQISLYEKRVENTPQREQQLMTLLRDYENTKKNYQALLDKKLNARISENLEKRQKGERFRVLDPANLPERPYSPDPYRVIGMGGAMGLAVGFGLVLLIEALDTSFRKPEEIEEALGLPVLISIPRMDRKKIRVALLGPTEGKPATRGRLTS